MVTLQARGLTKSYRSVRAVSDLSFTAKPGVVTGFLGPNGSGKTTTLKAMLGLIRADSGDVMIDGKPYAELRDPRRVVGAMLETTGFHPGRTGRDHLRVLAVAARLPHSRVDEVLDEVGLTDSATRRVRGYSLGMRQRLGLAAALLGDPEALVLDEPANGLDPAGMVWLRRLLRDRAARGGTVMVASHVLSEMEQTIDHVVIMRAGELRFDGRLADLAGESGSLEGGFLRLTTDEVAA
jgi:ABC-2 type transport system ATP-binding protein